MNPPSAFVWPILYSLTMTMIVVIAVWILFIEPLSPVVVEYRQSLVNGRIAARLHVPITRAEGLNITRFYEVRQHCPIDASLGIRCENGGYWSFPKRGGGVGVTDLGERPPRTFSEPLPDNIPLNTECEFLVRAESRCLVGTHIDDMLPAKFMLVRPSPP